MKSNDFVALMVQSPLHGLMGKMMLITVTGRRTGRKITLPVNYLRDGDTLWIISRRWRTWWRNVPPGSPVTLRLRGRDVTGIADPALDEASVATRLREYAQRSRLSAAYLGVRVQNGIPDTADVSRLAQERLFVSVCVSEGAG